MKIKGPNTNSFFLFQFCPFFSYNAAVGILTNHLNIFKTNIKALSECAFGLCALQQCASKYKFEELHKLLRVEWNYYKMSAYTIVK
jgi:hypothetical protein